jgi:hypothetical protein
MTTKRPFALSFDRIVTLASLGSVSRGGSTDDEPTNSTLSRITLNISSSSGVESFSIAIGMLADDMPLAMVIEELVTATKSTLGTELLELSNAMVLSKYKIRHRYGTASTVRNESKAKGKL